MHPLPQQCYHLDPNVLITLSKLRPVLGAHKGGASLGFGPENTLYSCVRSVREVGLNLLEVDVQASKDGHPVLIHAPKMETTTNVTGLVSDYTLAELRGVDATYQFRRAGGVMPPLPYVSPQDSYRLYRIATVEELFMEFRDRTDLIYMLDLKAERALEPTLNLIAVNHHFNKVVRQVKPPNIPLTTDELTVAKMVAASKLHLMSSVKQVHELVGTSYSIDIGKLPRSGATGQVLKGVEYAVSGSKGRILTERFVADVHKTGRLFAVYGSELGAPDIICECLNMGVDILFSDNPPLAKSTVDAWKRERNNLCLY